MSKVNPRQGTPWQKFTGPNLGYVMEMYERYVEGQEDIDPELKQLFDEWGEPSLNDQTEQAVKHADISFQMPNNPDMYSKIVAAVKLADNIRTYGHLAADINPLSNAGKETGRIDAASYDLTEADLKQVPPSLIAPNAPSNLKDGLEAIEHLKMVYTHRIAFEYHQVHDIEEKNWLQNQIESEGFYPDLTKEQRIELLKRFAQVEGFEKFIHRTFVGQKRFSIEGLDALVPLMDEVIRSSVSTGTKTINIGMAHRGRLNVLAHILEKPYKMIFSEFQNTPNKDLIPSEGSIGITYGWTGDVKYHLGADRRFTFDNDAKARITLANNPSHLEVVGPVLDGYTRAAQENRTKPGYPTQDVTSSLAICVHGDAAFPGEGIVQEMLNMGQLEGYATGGTVHIIANNMIGFTTESRDSRSTKYASDIAKGFEIPIVHVNADDPESVLAAAILATKYREKFHKDFVIDLIGYRRYGHNETDDPMVTNPMMYTVVSKHPTVKDMYARRLVDKGLLTEDGAKAIDDEIQSQLQAEYDAVYNAEKDVETSNNPPESIMGEIDVELEKSTKEQLISINDELLTWPEQFHVLSKLSRILKRREAVANGEAKIDWAHAESLAFATILQNGTPIRFTGQDSQRGTFAHRHLVLHDEKTGEEFIPMHHVSDAKASFTVHNSPLTEAAVVGFEYGYNVFAPETLVLWEAQFGDFANMAQVYFDQFISSGRAKWGQASGLVMLLPHGYEGQGPEHSSGRVERFLQSSAEHNWTVANLSKASQYFHLLRRQAASLQQENVRPLVIMTPKSLLRHPLAAADVNELAEGKFEPLLEQEGLGTKTDQVTRLVLSTGKVSIDLEENLKDINDLDWLHLARVEELYPFPKQELAELVERYPHLEEILWVQEEPKNMGAWMHVERYLRRIAGHKIDVRYVGRRRRSSPSEGDPTAHRKEQTRIIQTALSK